MGKNYTKPHDKNYEDTDDDYLYLSMCFSQALGEVLGDGQGVFIKLKGDALKIHPIKQVIVFNDGKMMRVIDATDKNDMKHGNRVIMIDKNIISN